MERRKRRVRRREKKEGRWGGSTEGGEGEGGKVWRVGVCWDRVIWGGEMEMEMEVGVCMVGEG